jgi:hypothetical protein
MSARGCPNRVHESTQAGKAHGGCAESNGDLPPASRTSRTSVEAEKCADLKSDVLDLDHHAAQQTAACTAWCAVQTTGVAEPAGQAVR